jgi:integrase
MTNRQKEKHMTKRSFGYIRQLPSGKYQASYVGPDGARHKAPLTFKQRSSAREFLKDQEALIQLNQWDQNSDCGLPDQVAPLFGPYCERHISIQTTPLGDLLELSTQALYRNLLRTHLSPFASFRLDEITEVTVNDWWAKAIKSGKKTALSKCYKLLASVMKRAVTEKYLLENPCRVKGAHSATTGKKVEVPTSEEISELARHMNPRYRVMVLVAASAGLRFGELTALRRCDFVPSIRDGRKALNIVVSRAVGWADGVPYVKPPKSVKGSRVVPLRTDLTATIEQHLDSLVDRDSEALVFPSESGTFLRHDVFTNSFRAALKRSGLSKRFTPHGLRHYFGTELGRVGANMAELQEALGDSTVSSVMRYVHSTDRAEELIDKMRNAI